MALALLAMLPGCSMFSGWFGGSAAGDSRPAATCPTAAVLRPLAQTAQFAPGWPHQPQGVAFYGVLSDVEARCDRAGDALRVKLDVVVVGERGPAAGTLNTVDLDYFVALTGPGQAILDKRPFRVRIVLPEAAKRAGVNDHFEETVPTGGRPPGDLSLIVGFQQAPDVVEFYRKFRGR